MNIALFCAAVVSVLLLSENLFNFMTNVGVFELPACYLILITGAILTPLTWLRSPKDFWLSAVVASFATAVTAILIIVGVAQVSTVTFVWSYFVARKSCKNFVQKMHTFARSKNYSICRPSNWLSRSFLSFQIIVSFLGVQTHTQNLHSFFFTPAFLWGDSRGQ